MLSAIYIYFILVGYVIKIHRVIGILMFRTAFILRVTKISSCWEILWIEHNYLIPTNYGDYQVLYIVIECGNMKRILRIIVCFESILT